MVKSVVSPRKGRKVKIQIGAPHWRTDLDSATAVLGKDFWSKFTPANDAELDALEAGIKRKLPEEFKEFYRKVGYGRFPPEYGGGFDSPAEILADLCAPIYFMTGSLTSGKEWATKEQQDALWLSRGGENPNPKLFTDKVLSLHGVKLYDLLEFGSDGNCCYHHLYVGPEPARLRYCLLTEDQTLEKTAPTLSAALGKMIKEWVKAFHFYKNDVPRWYVIGDTVQIQVPDSVVEELNSYNGNYCRIRQMAGRTLTVESYGSEPTVAELELIGAGPTFRVVNITSPPYEDSRDPIPKQLCLARDRGLPVTIYGDWKNLIENDEIKK